MARSKVGTSGALRRARRVLTWVLLLVTTLLLVVVVLVPRLAGATSYSVLTGSMSPTLPSGTLVVVRPVDPADVGVGSVVTYQLRPGEPEVVTHRVVSASTDEDGVARYRLQGDANDDADPGWVRPEQLRGTVWYAVPHLGHVNSLLSPVQLERLRFAAALALLGYALLLLLRGVVDLVRGREPRPGLGLLVGGRHG